MRRMRRKRQDEEGEEEEAGEEECGPRGAQKPQLGGPPWRHGRRSGDRLNGQCYSLYGSHAGLKVARCGVI